MSKRRSLDLVTHASAMSKRASRPALSASPLARRAQVSPVHSIAPRLGSDESSHDEAIDVHLEEDLLLEIRINAALVKKEKYLEQLEGQLRDGDDQPRNKEHALREDEDTAPSLDRCSLATKGSFAQQHFRACFVELNPVQLRDIRCLELPDQNLHIQHLRTLAKNLFLFSALRAINLSNNQLDDSGSMEIRDLMCCSTLQSLDLSRNLLGRLSARTICERLRHQVRLQALDLHGNLFFADGGSEAGEIARLFAKAVAVNESLLSFRLSALDQRIPRSSKRPVGGKEKPAEITSAAFEFSYHLAEQLQQGGKNSSLLSLSLVGAELSRKAVLNTVTMANRLTALDLSFAFIGIPGAQVVAAALRIEGYATLTQLNLRCNRTKSMGARAILTALRDNERVTDLNLCHNEIRSDISADVIRLLDVNRVLTRLDLSRNEILSQQTALESICDAITNQRSIRDLGALNSLGADREQARALQAALDRNRIADDQITLESTNNETATISRPQSDRQGKHVPLSSVVEFTLSEPTSSKTVWQRKVTREGRYSLRWKLAVRMKSSKKTSTAVDQPAWRVVVRRKCDVRGSVEDEALKDSSVRTGCIDTDVSLGYYTPCSAVAYCDEGDVMALVIEQDGPSSDNTQQLKVFVKDIALIPHHPQDRRHLLASTPRGGAGTAIQWQMRSKRHISSQEVHPSSFLWEGVLHRVYIHTTGIYRVLARVQLPTDSSKNVDALKSRFWWQLQRSSCWDHHTNDVVLEGTYLDLNGVVRSGCELVFYHPPMEWMAGEYLQLSVLSANDDAVVRVAGVQVFHQVRRLGSWIHHLNLTGYP